MGWWEGMVISALEALCDYALYKSTFTLHYITLQWVQYILPCDSPVCIKSDCPMIFQS